MASETTRLGLSLLQAAQAQKHITVNEALMRLDGVVNLVLQSVSNTAPPATVTDGQCWGVPAGAAGAWSGKTGTIAVGSNGGWIFVPAMLGMRGFIVDRGVEAVHDGAVWVEGVLSLGRLGSALTTGMVEADVNVTAGGNMDTGVTIPANAMVIGATAKVLNNLTGTLSSWALGTTGAIDRFGKGLGKSAGSYARGMLGSPMTYYASANLIMTGVGGNFSGGKVRLAVHWLELRVP
ncbi:DUF2793 domain-containing protein [Paracoccus sp. 11-3]|uniref:DUF2793 domain-containing protein n=1 Tax=Paracoccus amoyensis TaxID=2760093 RepID=A0A926GDW0_9RHOB|nr:DUF2793 domain-containing protein [Paracoccus amoyensis]MBC9245569.1 DUF2793 domain-containing protein [Paracoccus amoyensis]